MISRRQSIDNHTGRKHNPCSRPSTTIPVNILKNILKISDEANAVTTIPRKVLQPEEKIERYNLNYRSMAKLKKVWQ